MSWRRLKVWAVATAISLLWAAESFACPVCYGKTDAPVVKGAEMSIIFLGTLTYLLIGGGVAAFVVLRRRAMRENADETAAKDDTFGVQHPA